MTSKISLITGATGYVGQLITASLLTSTGNLLVLPVRTQHSPQSVLSRLKNTLLNSEFDPDKIDWNRVRVISLPPPGELSTLAPQLKSLGIEEILHCAGCIDYFDSIALQAVNIDFTQALLDLGKNLNIGRFIYISTSFSCGYVAGNIKEQLHPEPKEDPTDYTRSKRVAEHLVASSGLPYLIVRPSIVIGNSKNGRYGGKPYGIYQIMAAWERLLSDRYSPILHVVAPRKVIHVIHQDALQSGFLAAYHHLPTNEIFHLVSDPKALPTVRDLWEQWFEVCVKPEQVYYYEDLNEVPMEALDTRQRMLIEFTQVNLEIASHPWVFERRHLEHLCREGLSFRNSDIESLAVCQRRFVQDSPRLQKYLAQFGARNPSKLVSG